MNTNPQNPNQNQSPRPDDLDQGAPGQDIKNPGQQDQQSGYGDDNRDPDQQSEIDEDNDMDDDMESGSRNRGM